MLENIAQRLSRLWARVANLNELPGNPVSGGLLWFRDDQRGHVSSDGIDRDLVYSIAGRNDDLWIGRQRGGLTHLRPQAAAFRSVTYTQASGLAQNSVYSVYEARDGTVWAGTLGGGVSRVAAGRLTTYSTANGLISNTVNSMIEGPDGAMWFATPAGLSVLSKDIGACGACASAPKVSADNWRSGATTAPARKWN